MSEKKIVVLIVVFILSMLSSCTTNDFDSSNVTGEAKKSFIQIDSEKIHLENDHYICELSLSSGLKWNRIYNKDTQTDCLYDSGNMPIFRVLSEDGMDVDSTNFIIQDTDVTRQGANQSWSMTSTCPDENLEAVVTVEVNDSEQMVWSFKVKNTSALPRTLQPIFPFLGRIKMGTSLTDDKYFYPWRSGIVGDIDIYKKDQYGNLAWMQVVSVFEPNSGSGLFTYPKDANGSLKGILFKKKYSGQAVTVEHGEICSWDEEPYIGGTPGAHNKVDVLASVDDGIALTYYYVMMPVAAEAEYSLPETVVSIYQGGWKEALKDYSDWAHTWYTHVNTPQWFYNCFNYLGEHRGYYYDEQAGEYILASQRPKHHLHQWAHWWDYNDYNSPFQEAGDFYYNEDRGGLAAFAAEIDAIQSRPGEHMSVYIDYHHCWRFSDAGLWHPEWAAHIRPGIAMEWGCGECKWVTCPYEPNAFPDYIAQTCARVVNDTNMHCIYLDEMPLLYPCHNPGHIHYQQDGKSFSVPRMVDYITISREAIRSAYADGALMTEHAGSDYFTQFFDGSWDQTFAQLWPNKWPEQYFDENSLYYFRFCFPEFKLAEWGESDDDQHRTFFNGIGICKMLSPQLAKSGGVLQENGDAFASLNPEPLIETKVKKVLANKFPTADKTVYTVYNKNDKPINAVIMEVDAKQGYHFVEMVYDEEVKSALNPAETKQALKLQIKADDVVCIGRLPQIIQTKQQDGNLIISLKKNIKDARLVAYLDKDTSGMRDDKGARPIELAEGLAIIDPEKLFGQKGKLILKLMQGSFLIDEVIIQVK